MTVMVETECTTCGNRCESRILEKHDHLLDPLESNIVESLQVENVIHVAVELEQNV